jgi:hypothetical protein
LAIPSKHYSAIKGGLNENNVRDQFEFDEHAYTRARSSLSSAFIRILEGAGLSPSASLKAIRDAVPAVAPVVELRQEPVLAKAS